MTWLFKMGLGGICGAVWASGALIAQPDPVAPQQPLPVPVPAVPQQDPAEPEGVPEEEREYWEDTVERALEKAESENPEVRRSAIMLLGKYPVPQAEQAVVAALEDADAGVRQAALVSLFERRRIYRGETAVKIAERVGDSDVGIRRIASNVLPMVMHGFPLSMSQGQRRPVRDLPEGLKSILEEAFRDEDTTVRRNMISHFSQLQIPVSEALMADLLHDSDREVAIEALHVAGRHFGPDLIAREAPELVDHPDRIFRLTLARQLGDGDSGAATEALARLREDEDVEVSLEAELAFFRQAPEPDHYARLLERFAENPGHQEIARRAIRAARLLDDQAEPFLRRWMEHSNPSYREAAVQLYFARFPDRVGEEDLLALLEEDTRRLREAAVRFLRRHSTRVSPRLLEAAAESRHVEVRRAAIAFTRYLPAGESEEVLREMLLDDDSQVRAEAIDEVASRQMDGWERILALSLRDNDPTIREAGLRGLTREVTPETLGKLKEFLENHPGSPLRRAIEKHLAQYDEEPAGPGTDSEL